MPRRAVLVGLWAWRFAFPVLGEFAKTAVSGMGACSVLGRGIAFRALLEGVGDGWSPREKTMAG